MSTELALRDDHPALATMPQGALARGTSPEAWHVMKSVLFKGASDEMICTLLDYCKARKLDPLKKPFHIVKVWDSEAKGYVESIWPSVGELRITAMRTGQYAGKSDIEFGPDMTKKWGSGNDAVEIVFPEWAQCRVFRLCDGQRVEFAGSKVYWLETYASIRGGAPNSMWRKRPRGQLAKCAEADALRSAFPEECGTEPTSEEMEGRIVGAGEFGPERARVVNPTSYGVARFATPPGGAPPPAPQPHEPPATAADPEATAAAGQNREWTKEDVETRGKEMAEVLRDHGNSAANLSYSWQQHEDEIMSMPGRAQKGLRRVYETEMAKIERAAVEAACENGHVEDDRAGELPV